MFTIRKIPVRNGMIEDRRERYTGLRCRISPDRSKRHINRNLILPPVFQDCPFCPENVEVVTPVFPDYTRYFRGESITFPNLFPFGEWHTVTVITRSHQVLKFSHSQIADALSAQAEILQRFDGFASINWNYLPSAGASLVHPHMQALSDRRPSPLVERYFRAGARYFRKTGTSYWEAVREQERDSDRFLFGEEIFWHAHAVPVGEREVRGILPITAVDELECFTDRLAEDILTIMSLYRKLGTHAFNMSIFFEKNRKNRNFSAFCSLISRINPNPDSMSDTAFMERLHQQPIILTLPEDLGTWFRGAC
ncbi:MAG TPA: galactose-1-phosphate uridylyltransferase [Methanoregulaceae archaeon]|nr:galactose-1-phosphate uridylyltransferase [Methanoregulaceae archaeon]HPD74912.1 galactose-1-phosphate uridylyltransferase [Methanoregulaceae archaeon]